MIIWYPYSLGLIWMPLWQTTFPRLNFMHNNSYRQKIKIHVIERFVKLIKKGSNIIKPVTKVLLWHKIHTFNKPKVIRPIADFKSAFDLPLLSNLLIMINSKNHAPFIQLTKSTLAPSTEHINSRIVII